MLRLLSFLLLICLFSFSPAKAEEKKKTEAEPPSLQIPKGDFSNLKHTKSGRIDKIIDGLTILLKDGTIIRLASLDIPDFHIWRDAPYSESALELLQKTLPEGTDIMMYQTRMAKKGRITRMKHELAHIETKKDKIWIQGLLLAHGLARVYTAPNATEMLGQMYKAEQGARTAKRGIWAQDSDYLVLTPETAEKSMKEFVIVEGIVQKTATVRNNIYLNFGKNWKTDFTIMISPAHRKKLARQGVNLFDMAHKPVRVRGWLREYNGPMIELEDPSHLEYPLPRHPVGMSKANLHERDPEKNSSEATDIMDPRR